MSKIIDNTLVMSQEETFNEMTKFLSENQAPDVDKKLLKEQIDNIINEELGIADEVIKLSDLIEKKIYQLLNNGTWEEVFNVKTDLSEVNVDFAYNDFATTSDAIMWIKYNRGNDGYSYKTNTIYITLVSVNGYMNDYDLADTIQHECTHYWELKNRGEDTYNSVYEKVVQGVNSRNPVLELMCSILYYSNKGELNAFVNGTYASAMKKKTKYESYNEFIADNQVNDIYEVLKDAKSLIEEKNQPLIFSASFWIVSNGILNCEIDDVPNKIIKIANNSFNYLMKKIGRAYAFYCKKLEEYEEQMMHQRIKNIFRKCGIKNGDV